MQDVVDSLYHLAVVEGKSTSIRRLSVLANLCTQELELRGITETRTEIPIPGMGRTKKWDVVWSYGTRRRLGISLKSLLRNPQGTVPNRIDDLMGEMANVQLWSPEIVTGYIVVFNVDPACDGMRNEDGLRWSEFFRQTISHLSGRNAPAWAPGMVEVTEMVKVDFSSGPKLVGPHTLDTFFDKITKYVKARNPDAFLADGLER